MARAVNGSDFWEITNSDGSVAWLGLTRLGASSAIDRQKVWTLMPSSRMFVANWFVTEDPLRRLGPGREHRVVIVTGQASRTTGACKQVSGGLPNRI